MSPWKLMDIKGLGRQSSHNRVIRCLSRRANTPAFPSPCAANTVKHLPDRKNGRILSLVIGR
ncbi:hypothetical protein [Brenneria roseae]|uniref:hypothetical protein n=1 Tax=Brenneria roseae TaxID=1509241 RepID=UPI0011B22ADA|nr:hypothetical protein [Brenneria roseae]